MPRTPRRARSRSTPQPSMKLPLVAGTLVAASLFTGAYLVGCTGTPPKKDTVGGAAAPTGKAAKPVAPAAVKTEGALAPEPVQWPKRADDPTELPVVKWPPRGSKQKFMIARDTWVSWYKGEKEGNQGGEQKLKTKGNQEITLIDLSKADLASLKGKVVTGAVWHFHNASPKAPFKRLSVSTVATPWVEGTGRGYKQQQGSACYTSPELGKRDWAYPGSTLMGAAFGRGHTLWRFADSTKPDGRGWQNCAVEPAVVQARVAGVSHGFAVYDDVGSEWTRTGDKVKCHVYPNRFAHSRESGKFAPYLEIWTDGTDATPPAKVSDVRVATKGFPAGQALVTWATPADEGGAGTIGFVVNYAGQTKSGEMPRYLVPMAREPGGRVRMHVTDLDFASGEKVELTIAAVDGAGNTGEAVTTNATLSSTPPVFTIAKSDIAPFEPGGSAPRAGSLSVRVVDLLDKISPNGDTMIPKHPAGYLTGNHLFSASKKLVRLHSGRNEAVCFQVNLAGSTDDASMSLAFDDASLKVKLFRFDYVGTKAGPMPDALVPLKNPIRIPAGDDPEAAGQKNASFLCEVYVPHATSPGKKSGTLTVKEGGSALELTVDLEVWEFTLPNKLSFLAEMNAYGTAGPEGRALEYYRVAHEHRCVMNRLYYNWNGKPNQEPKKRGDDFDWEPWDARFGKLFDGSAFADLPRAGEPLDVFYLPFNENWPVDVYSSYRKSYWIEEAFAPWYKEKLKAAFAKFARHFDQKKWHDTIFQLYLNNKVYYKEKRSWSSVSAPWIFDEPCHTQDFWALRWYGILFHQAVDPVKGNSRFWYRCDISRTNFSRTFQWGIMDIEVLGGSSTEKIRMRADEDIHSIKTYFTQYGSANDPADANTQPAAWCLSNWANGAVGALPWQTIATKNAWTKGEKTGLFYPRGDTVAPSVRLKAFRRGQQTIEYLTLLQDVYGLDSFAVRNGANSIVDLTAQVVKTWSEDAGTIRFSKSDPRALWELRYRVGAMVAAKKPAYKRAVFTWPSPPTDMSRLPPMGYVTVGPIQPKSRWDGDDARAPADAPPALPARSQTKRNPGGAAPEVNGTSIFNGRDLSGWRKAGDGAVERGSLVTRKGGDLYYKADWKTLTMSLEAKASGTKNVLLGLQLGQTGMGRGNCSISLVFYGDGDVHVRANNKMLGKSGSGKVDLSTWTDITVEHTGSSLRLWADGAQVVDVDISSVPRKRGGLYVYSSGQSEAAVRELRVDGR